MRLSRPSFSQFLAATGLALALSCTSLPALAGTDQPHASTPAVAEQARHKAADHTQALMALQKRWAKAQGSEKSRALQQMIARAEERRAFLLDLMTTHPADVLRVAIPEDRQQGMPAEVLELLEQQLEVEGELESVYEDYEDGSHRLRQFMQTPFGERFELHFTDKSQPLKSGAHIRARGLFVGTETLDEGSLDGALAMDSSETSILTLAADGGVTGGSNGGTAATLPHTLGEQRTLVLLVNFQDQPGNRPWTIDQYRDLVFGETNAYFQEASYGKTWLSGDVFGWYTLPLNSTSCDQWGIANAAVTAASAAGVDVVGYDRLVFAYPHNANCTWSGMGTVGGVPSKTWINGGNSLYTLGHEMGHNLGLHHANSLECGTASVGNSCSVGTYGDSLDIMGSAPSGHYNAYHKDRLGWLNANDASLVTVESPGSYDLDALESSPSGTAKALKILKEVDAASGEKTWYYVELRQAIGFDNFLSGNANILGGATVHTGQEQNGNSSRLLDMTPDSGWPAGADWADTALVEGQSFSDPDAGVTLTTSWVAGASATVDVDLGPQPCIQAAPAVALSGQAAEWVSAGTAITYTFAITNRDSSQCAATAFNLSANAPNGWTSTLAENSLTLAPGSSATASLTVSSPASAADGFYSIGLNAASGAYTTAATATYVIDTPASNRAPVAVDDSAATDENTPLTITVLTNDSDADGDLLTVTAAGGASHGSIVINPDYSLTYTPASGFTGSDTLTYSISDGRGASDSATVTIEVTAVPAPEPANRAPVAVDDTAYLSSKDAITLVVLGNDWDPENDRLSVINVTQGAKGSVYLNANGTLQYVPAKQFKDSDSFSYTISDGKLSATASVAVQLQGADTGNGGGGKGKGPNK